MVFLHNQTKHPLIPQSDREAERKLAQKTQNFRRDFFLLLKEQIEAIASQSAKESNNQVYARVRQQLNQNPDIQEGHRQRTLLQDELWQQVISSINGDRLRLTKAFEFYHWQKNQGLLELNPEMEYPAHQLKTEIHRMPGGYCQNCDESDFFTGAMYDHGVFLYGQGWFGSLNDELGKTVINHVLWQHYPQLKPQTILDLGCSVGHSTLPYKEEYPDAEVWGIDLGAALLRYASARAKSLEREVYFSQQNAEQTSFQNNYFDLIVSHILLHEIPSGSRKKVFQESYRLLKPGGVMIHIDSQSFLSPSNLITRYFRDTEVWVNSEPYLGSSNLADLQRYVKEAGFDRKEFKVDLVPGYYAVQKGNDKAGWMALSVKKR